MVKAGEPAAQKLVESKYCFEYEISGRVFPYAFDPEKRTLKICRGATADGIPIGDIQILHKSVSREKHATIGYNGSECVLKDVGSRNGTYVLDHQPEPGEKPKWNKIEKPYGLRNGEVLKFGDAVLTYREKKK
ncbi:MAG: FHA domain-containing protein [archaeon]|nr:FHA domain-containing protein [archaeon]